VTWKHGLSLLTVVPQAWLVAAGIYTVDGDINDLALLARLFGMCSFTHVLHLAAQVRTRS
jgi:UDP-glucose 4-epimerase